MKKIVPISIILLIISLLIVKINSLENEDDGYEVPPKNVAIGLNYHRVREKTVWNKGIELVTQSKELTTYSVYEDTFEQQLDTLIESGAYFATPSELGQFSEDGQFPDKCVWISFDDIDKTVYDIAFPILKEKGIPFTVFVISGEVGGEDFDSMEMVTWDDLREMRDSGLVTFGSHTHDMHYLEGDKAIFLYEKNYDKFEKDIKLSKRIMEKELNVEVNTMAYPFGDASDDVAEICKKSGYDYAYLLSPNPICIDDDPYHISRYLTDKNNFDKILIPWLNLYN